MDNFELIERYLQDKMSKSERSDFESRLIDDVDLKTEVNAMRDLVIGIESHGLKNALKGRKIGESISNKTESTTTNNVISINKKKSSTFRTLAAAASVAGIFFLSWWILQSPSSSDEQLFADAFYTDPGLPTPMSKTNNYNFYDAMVDYKMEKYEVAFQKWNEIESGIGQDTLDFYKGMALINKGNLEKSISILNQIDKNSSFYNKANWYKIRVLIDQKKYDEAKSLLRTIPKSTHSHYDKIVLYLKEK